MEVASRRREQEVWQACDDLWAMHGDMKHVTGDCIRDRLINLGKSRGSPNEIYKYRKTWVHSRGLGSGENDPSNLADSDPITRAVRIVHDQLRDSTENRIEELKHQHADLIDVKNNEIVEIKRSLDTVLEEFAKLEENYRRTKDELASTTAERDAEIDIRRALEKELQLKNSLHDSEKQNLLSRIDELKEIFATQTIAQNERIKDLQVQCSLTIDEHNERIKKLGHDYSEQLMTLKTVIVNHEIVAKHNEEKAAQWQIKINNVQADLKLVKQDLADANAEKTRLLVERATEKANALEETIRRAHAKKEARVQARALKNAELTIARLRATLAHVTTKNNSDGERSC